MILTAPEAAEYLRISVRELRALTQQRRVPHFRLRDSKHSPLRFRRTDLDAWINGRVVAPTGPLPVRRSA